jgi:hypothetical protein
MIAGKKYVGPKADMWSLGVVLFALVCGFLPFEHDNTSELYKKILKGDYKCPKFISPQVKDLLKKILNTDPKQRYTIAQCRKHPWMQMVTVKNITYSKPLPRPTMLLNKNKLNGSSGGGSGGGSGSGSGSGSGGQNPESPTNAGNILASLDQQVLRQCTDLGFKPAQVVEGLVNKLENSATKAYQMLCSRKKKLAEAQRKKRAAAAVPVSVASATTPHAVAEVTVVPKKTTDGMKAKTTATVTTTTAETTPVATTMLIAPTDSTQAQSAGEPSGTTNSTLDTTSAQPPPRSSAVLETAGGRGRRVVPSANQNRNLLTQKPHRPKGISVKKSAVERQALQAISLAPMGSEGAEDNNTTTTTTTPNTNNEDQAWKTPRLDENGVALKVVPKRRPEGRQPVSARITATSTTTTPGNGAQTSRPTLTAANVGETTYTKVTSVTTSATATSNMEIIKGAFNVSHTSSKDPKLLLIEIKRVLQSIAIPFSMSKEYQLTCHKQNTRFKVEVSLLS